MSTGETKVRPTVSATAEGANLYERDFYSWTLQQAELLRSGNLRDADLPNIIEEIETLGRSERNALRSRYAVLCAHLLKSIVQPGRRGRSWERTIVEQRIQIAQLFDENPGLRTQREQLFHKGYEDARKLAAADMKLAVASLPDRPPFTVGEAEDETWRPSKTTSSDVRGGER